MLSVLNLRKYVLSHGQNRASTLPTSRRCSIPGTNIIRRRKTTALGAVNSWKALLFTSLHTRTHLTLITHIYKAPTATPFVGSFALMWVILMLFWMRTIRPVGRTEESVYRFEEGFLFTCEGCQNLCHQADEDHTTFGCAYNLIESTM